MDRPCKPWPLEARHPADWLWGNHLEAAARPARFKPVPSALKPVKDWLNEGSDRYGFSGDVSFEVWLVRAFEVYEKADSKEEADESWTEVGLDADGNLKDGETRHYHRRKCADFVPIRLCAQPWFRREDEFLYVGYPFTRRSLPTLERALESAVQRIRGEHNEKPYRIWYDHRPEGKDDTPVDMGEMSLRVRVLEPKGE